MDLAPQILQRIQAGIGDLKVGQVELRGEIVLLKGAVAETNLRVDRTNDRLDALREEVRRGFENVVQTLKAVMMDVHHQHDDRVGALEVRVATVESALRRRTRKRTKQ